MRRALAVAGLSVVLGLCIPGFALAQDDPPVANCDPFSSLVCQVPVQVNVGPFNVPVEIGSIFAPPPATP